MAELTLDRIVSSGLCTGCGACVYAVGGGNVSMQLDAAGFLRPVSVRPLSAVEEQSVRDVCPGIGLEHPPNAQIPYEPLWGPLLRVAAGHASDTETRHRASSGGVLSALLIHLLETGKVDFVLHIRADEDAPLRNVVCFSRTREQVLTAAGSRYAPASPVAALGDALKQEGRFAFVGKPCDVAAVRKILTANPKLNARIPYLLSFMCAGTPSIEGTTEILTRFQMTADEVTSFRYRGDGWPGYAKAVTKEGREGCMDYNTAWGKILNRHLQARCKKCADGTGEFADLVCADAWHGKDGYPDFTEAAGRSLIIARSEVGNALLRCAEEKGDVTNETFDIKDIAAIQPYQKNRKAQMLARSFAVALYFKPWPRYKGFRLHECAWHLGFRKSLRAFLGTALRAARGRV